MAQVNEMGELPHFIAVASLHMTVTTMMDVSDIKCIADYEHDINQAKKKKEKKTWKVKF